MSDSCSISNEQYIEVMVEGRCGFDGFYRDHEVTEKNIAMLNYEEKHNGIDNLIYMYAKWEAIQELDDDTFYVKKVCGVFKRVCNITKGGVPDTALDTSLFVGKPETELFKRFCSIANIMAQQYKKGMSKNSFKIVIIALSTFKDFVETFFNEVRVFVDDLNVRNNRLTLLSYVESLFLLIARWDIIKTS